MLHFDLREAQLSPLEIRSGRRLAQLRQQPFILRPGFAPLVSTEKRPGAAQFAPHGNVRELGAEGAGQRRDPLPRVLGLIFQRKMVVHRQVVAGRGCRGVGFLSGPCAQKKQGRLCRGLLVGLEHLDRAVGLA